MQQAERYERLPLEQISPPSHQLRSTIETGALGELADSMATEGLHQPVGVRGPTLDGRYEIVWGHRRLLAARLLGWETITARVFPHAFDPLLAAISENLQRTDLNPLEEAHACHQFIERGQPIPGIARLFRRSEPWVRDRLALLDLPEDLQRVVAARTLPLAVVRTLSDIDHQEYREECVREAVRTGATAATAEVWRAHYLSDRERIIHNRLVVAEILESRSSFVITYPCDWCDQLNAYEHTRALRLCLNCANELDAAKRNAQAQQPA